MRLFLHELRAEQRLFWRNREAAFFTFLLPVIFFLIFGSVYGDAKIKGEPALPLNELRTKHEEWLPRYMARD